MSAPYDVATAGGLPETVLDPEPAFLDEVRRSLAPWGLVVAGVGLEPPPAGPSAGDPAQSARLIRC